jgi:propanediol dehydratase small subunit
MSEHPTAVPPVTSAAEGDAPVRALSGRPVRELTLELLRAGEAGPADLRIHPETLLRQAAIADAHGNPQLAANLRRAAELTSLPDEEVLSVYEALRPGRSSAADLEELASSLASRGLPLNAALIAEAAEVYARRGLARGPHPGPSAQAPAQPGQPHQPIRPPAARQ